MGDSWRPTDDAQVREAVAWASAEQVPLEIVGQGSKRGWGRPLQCERDLDLSGLNGITLYEPGELVLSARAGTALAEIREALAAEHQELAFEPPDLAPFFGRPAGAGAAPGTIGGAIATNLSGPRRIKAGAARDHFLGFQAVSGRGERFKSGGRVMKNVTGYDLSKLLAGSFGTLAVMTEVTVKVLPAPEKQRTVLLFGLAEAAAVAALSAALGSPHEVSGAAHLPAAVAAGSGVDFVAGAGTAVTAIRLEGHGPSVEARCDALRRELADRAPCEELHSRRSRALWREIGELAPFVARPELAVWRVSVAPSDAPALVEALAALPDLLHYLDWGGGLLWLGTTAGETAAEVQVRGAVAACGGHATLLRAPARVRLAVPVFQPVDPVKAALSRRVKEGFDPRRILNPGRMVADL